MITVKRTAIWEVLKQKTLDKPIQLPYSKEELQELFFDQKEDSEGNIYYEINSIMYKLISKIDCSNISFDNVKMSELKLNYAYNIRFNPQNIYKRSLQDTSLGKNVEIIGNENLNQKDLFEGVNVSGTNFNYCKNVRINPQTVQAKDFSYSSLAGVDFTGFSFDGARLWYTNFKDSIGVELDPNKVKSFEKISSLDDVTLTDIYEDDRYAKASGAKNYNDLMLVLTNQKAELEELIKDQLPEEKKEYSVQPLVEQPKQKRKWFSN